MGMMVAMFLLGCVVAGALNLGIYGLAWDFRPISPWSVAHPRDAASDWRDRLPLVGWWRLRRLEPQLGRGFWLRPLAVELLTGSLFVVLYTYHVLDKGLYGPQLPLLATGSSGHGIPLMDTTLYWHLASHLVLTALMLVATFIDLDEQTVPDGITVPGTWLGLTLAVVWPWSLLPMAGIATPPGELVFEFMNPSSPNAFQAELQGGAVAGLLVGLGCFWLWCISLLPWRWIGRRGYAQGLIYAFERVRRGPYLWRVSVMGLAGTVLIAVVWNADGARWVALLSSLVGMVVGGILIWLVRVGAGWALQQEAMGYGDVTLMAMIGAFVGWQACVIIFFLAPFAALVYALLRMLSRGTGAIPYGPFLCLATLVVVFQWPWLWYRVIVYFEISWLVPTVLTMGMLLLAGLLLVWRQLRQWLFGF